jgi:hypothetical protein
MPSPPSPTLQPPATPFTLIDPGDMSEEIATAIKFRSQVQRLRSKLEEEANASSPAPSAELIDNQPPVHGAFRNHVQYDPDAQRYLEVQPTTRADRPKAGETQNNNNQSSPGDYEFKILQDFMYKVSMFETVIVYNISPMTPDSHIGDFFSFWFVSSTLLHRLELIHMYLCIAEKSRMSKSYTSLQRKGRWSRLKKHLPQKQLPF